MSGVITREAAQTRLGALRTAKLVGCKMRLLSGNITPAVTTTLATLLANEASFTGYSPATMSTWSAVALNGSNEASTTSTDGQFTGTSGGGTGSLYGYFLTDPSGTEVYAAERFASAPLSQAQNVVFEVDCNYLDIPN